MKTSQSAWHSVRLVHVNGLKGAKLTWLDRVGYPMNSVGTVPTEFCRFCEKRGSSLGDRYLGMGEEVFFAICMPGAWV